MTDSLPNILYHYCPAAALPDILRTGSFWISHHSGLNDLRDSAWAVPIIHDEIKKRQNETTAGFLSQVGLVFNMNRPRVYIGSFSCDGDVLSQWRAYASDGEGFAIGFRPASFCAEVKPPMTSADPAHTVGFVKVYYNDMLLRRVAGAVLDNHLSKSSSGDDSECAIQLRNVVLSFKNPAFREEDEWRIIYSPLVAPHPDKPGLRILGKFQDIRFRSTRYGLLPYFEVPFQLPGRDDSIIDVVIGPKNPTDSDILSLGLVSQGYRQVNVRRSAASYR